MEVWGYEDDVTISTTSVGPGVARSQWGLASDGFVLILLANQQADLSSAKLRINNTMGAGQIFRMTAYNAVDSSGRWVPDTDLSVFTDAVFNLPAASGWNTLSEDVTGITIEGPGVFILTLEADSGNAGTITVGREAVNPGGNNTSEAVTGFQSTWVESAQRPVNMSFRVEYTLVTSGDAALTSSLTLDLTRPLTSNLTG